VASTDVMVMCGGGGGCCIGGAGGGDRAWLWLGSDTFLVSEGLLVCYVLHGVGCGWSVCICHLAAKR
jgi:hypothetical protein